MRIKNFDYLPRLNRVCVRLVQRSKHLRENILYDLAGMLAFIIFFQKIPDRR
jgi:hypothetical protein